jgi:hypothetical protein
MALQLLNMCIVGEREYYAEICMFIHFFHLDKGRAISLAFAPLTHTIHRTGSWQELFKYGFLLPKILALQ